MGGRGRKGGFGEEFGWEEGVDEDEDGGFIGCDA